MRFFWRSKATTIDGALIDSNSRSPATSYLTHPKIAACIVFLRNPTVLTIHQRRAIAQIFYTVPRFFAALVVNVIFRPFAVDIKPSQAVRQILMSVDADIPIFSTSVKKTRLHSGFPSFAGINFPRENPCHFVVMKKFFQAFMGDCIIQPAHLSFSSNDGSGSDAKGRKPLGIAHYSMVT